MSNLSSKTVEELQTILWEEYGKDVPDKDTQKMAEMLIEFFDTATESSKNQYENKS